VFNTATTGSDHYKLYLVKLQLQFAAAHGLAQLTEARVRRGCIDRTYCEQ
jgi:hypothetical protein